MFLGVIKVIRFIADVLKRKKNKADKDDLPFFYLLMLAFINTK